MSFPITRSGAAALAMSLALASSAAVAQKEPAKPAAPAPAAPAAPAPGAQPAAPQPPSKVDLVSPEPQWVKLCGKVQSPGGEHDACQTMRDFGQSADQPPMISMQVFEQQGEEKRKLRFMILPIGMLLRPGFRIIVDKAEPLEGKYDMCFQSACTAEMEISPGMLGSMKKGQNLAIVMRLPGGDQSGRELTLNIPLKDFGATFDGKPTDPKVLEQQRQALQQQLQKRAEEQRKMLEQQQQQQSGVAAPAAPGAPVSPAAPAAPAPKQ